MGRSSFTAITAGTWKWSSRCGLTRAEEAVETGNAAMGALGQPPSTDGVTWVHSTCQGKEQFTRATLASARANGLIYFNKPPQNLGRFTCQRRRQCRPQTVRCHGSQTRCRRLRGCVGVVQEGRCRIRQGPECGLNRRPEADDDDPVRAGCSNCSGKGPAPVCADGAPIR